MLRLLLVPLALVCVLQQALAGQFTPPTNLANVIITGGTIAGANASNALISTRAGGDSSTLANRIGAWCDPVEDYGADPTGTTDSSAAINSCLAAGLQTKLPAGTFLVSSESLAFGAGSSMDCDPAAEIESAGSLALLDVTGSDASIVGCNFLKTSGSAILGAVSSDHFSWNGGSSNGFAGLFFTTTGAYAGVVQNTRQINSTGSAITEQNGAYDIQTLNNEFENNTGFGVLMTAGAHDNLSQGDWTLGNRIELVGISYTGFNNKIIGDSAAYTGDNCFSLSGSNNTITGSHAVDCAFTGISIAGDLDTASGNFALDNGQAHNPASSFYNAANTNNYSGIEINAGVGGTGDNNTVVGNTVDDDQATPTQSYAGNIAAGYANWAAATVYAAGAYVSSGGYIYMTTAGGTSGAAPGPTGTATPQTDGTVSWTYINTSPWLSAEPAGNTFGPNTLYRYKVQQFIDQTTNHANLKILGSSFGEFVSPGTTPAASTVDAGFQQKAPSWSSGISVVFGNIYYNPAGENRYEVINAGGSSTVSPTFTTGEQTLTDGVEWLWIGSGNLQPVENITGAAVSLQGPLGLVSSNQPGQTPEVFSSANSPAGIVTASPGSLYLQTNGGEGTTLYLKDSGTGTSGWDAIPPPYLIGTTGGIGGSALAAGACTSGTVAISGATTGMSVIATPITYPGDGIWWEGYISAAGTATVKVCASVSATPIASAYNARVIQ